jgi:molecular chaperone Hsp33
MSETVSRPVSDLGLDDQVLPFAVEPLDVRGRIVRLGPALDQILARHAYPEVIARAVGEAIVLTVLLASALKLEGRFQLQTRTDGILDMLIVDFDAPDSIRAVARFDKARLAKVTGAPDPRGLFGRGHLALTIDQGGDMSRYQGIVALEGQTLEEAAHQYFRQSEQIPTYVRLAVAESLIGSASSWRAGGLLVQFLPKSPERQRQADFDPGDAPEGIVVEPFVEDDAWSEAKLLAASVEDHELVDPTLSSERLLYRLFHEHGVKVFTPSAVRDHCRCSAERIEAMLRSFSKQEIRDMVGDNGLIGVTCEFCSVHREFDPALLEADPSGTT